MTKIAQSFYSAAIGHKDIDGIYLASFAIPGDIPAWVTGDDGKPRHFRSAVEAELAGFRVMAAKLNRSRDVQSFMTARDRKKGQIVSYRAPQRNGEPTVEQVFGKK